MAGLGVGVSGNQALQMNKDGTLQYDSSRELEAIGRPLEQHCIAPFANPGVTESAPCPPVMVLGSGADLLTPSNIRPDSDDSLSGSISYA